MITCDELLSAEELVLSAIENPVNDHGSQLCNSVLGTCLPVPTSLKKVLKKSPLYEWSYFFDYLATQLDTMF